jgi:hypothetical protein
MNEVSRNSFIGYILAVDDGSRCVFDEGRSCPIRERRVAANRGKEWSRTAQRVRHGVPLPNLEIELTAVFEDATANIRSSDSCYVLADWEGR